jgi:hypothetical protein
MAGMGNTHGITLLAFGLLGAVALAHGLNFVAAPEFATPNHDPYHARALRQAAAQMVATPNHDPLHVRAVPQLTAQAVATPNDDPLHVRAVSQLTAEAVTTPNHDPLHFHAMPSVAANLVLLRAEPEAAAPSALAFVATDTNLYAKASARLRAAPSTAADVLTTLTADAPLHAIARSTDGAWWQVSLADPSSQQGRTGYVHRNAVTKSPVLLAKATPVTLAPVAVAYPRPAPVPARSNRDLLGFADEAMNWVTDMAGRGSAPKIVRTEH